MVLSGLHLLLTYQCNFECDHCFVWGGPQQSGTMTMSFIREVLGQAKDLGSVQWIYFEGGEPFLYYAVMLKMAREAAGMGFKVGLVSNAYWATAVPDALEWLGPLAGTVLDLSVSSDLFHWSEKISREVQNAREAAEQLGIPIGFISIAQPEDADRDPATGQLPVGESGVMYQGRAAHKLTADAPKQPWTRYTECPHEDLREPGRLHLDPLGNLHICHGISLGNVHDASLSEICRTYDPDAHPIAGPLLAGGPAELVRRYGLPLEDVYADACHLCDTARRRLRSRFPDILMPDQMYGVHAE